jgi:hypothetical protein
MLIRLGLLRVMNDGEGHVKRLFTPNDRVRSIEIGSCTPRTHPSQQVDLVGRCEIRPLPKASQTGASYHRLAR